MVFTDPPYGVAIGDKNAVLNSVQKAGLCTENIANDTKTVPELYVILQQAMANVRLSCKSDAVYFVCAPPGGDFCLMMMMMMRDAGLTVRHQIVWNKNSATFSLGRLDYDYKHEAIMYTWTDKHHNYRKGAFRTSVWDIDKPLKCDLHPTMKPVELVSNAILDGTLEGDVVLDVFGGSGTTIVACEQLGRKCYTMEIDPHYCDVILSRWEKLTGRTAEKIN
jgi:site-specific DNA-methyltransferase (adenine-specific)